MLGCYYNKYSDFLLSFMLELLRTTTSDCKVALALSFRIFFKAFVFSITIFFILIFRCCIILRVIKTQHILMKSTCDVESQAKQCVSVQKRSTDKHTSQFCTSCVGVPRTEKEQKKQTNKHAQQLLTQFFMTGPL